MVVPMGIMISSLYMAFFNHLHLSQKIAITQNIFAIAYSIIFSALYSIRVCLRVVGNSTAARSKGVRLRHQYCHIQPS